MATYIIRSGDTCWAITEARGITPSDFLKWNAGIECDNLQIGQRVYVSQPAPASTFRTPSSSSSSGKIFREYIGVHHSGVCFSDVPIRDDVTFHFILAFAIDYTPAAAATNGEFNVHWHKSALTPDEVKAIKARHKNVKVLVSLGGDTISGQHVQFRPSSVRSWVDNAVSSLTRLIKQYHLDGIDIDYEHFDEVSTQDFALCIGRLIRHLKSQRIISVASIAPYDEVETQYHALWRDHGSVIDFVNFHFFTYKNIYEVEQYVRKYDTAAAKYGGGAKVLASFSTGGVGPPPSVALSACRQLKASGKLPGIFIFSADHSFASSAKFWYEQEAQNLLAS